MPTGVSKLQLLIELKNKLKVGLDSAKQQVAKATGGMQRKLDGFKISSARAFGAVKEQVAGSRLGFAMMGGPIIAATAAVAGLGMAIGKSMQEAQAFAGSFRQLQMLNLDKPVKAMGNLKNMIRDTAFEKGFDPQDTIKAFFDVQSTTGKFGGEVDAIIAKQGEFARLMQADFNSWISGTAKAMANYGFGAEKLDEFNRAAFATVQTGVTTFDELAKVQSVYAGAAAAAKQNFASANKLFSIFTVKVKSVDEAATLTKSLFNDLTKAETINAFKKVGISVFDANNQFKQADVLLLELQNKFKVLGTSDQKLIDLKNQFTGSEGLIGFVQAATDKTNQLQNTISTFDTTQFALPKALEIAKNDINYINEQLQNRTKVLMGEIGENFLPMKMAFLEFLNEALVGINHLFTGIERFSEKAKNKAANDQLKRLPGLHNPLKLSNTEFDALMATVDKRIAGYSNIAEQNQKFTENNFSAFDKLSNRKTEGRYKYDYASGAITSLKELQKQAREARAKMGADFTGAPDGASTPAGTADVPGSNSSKNAQTIAAGSQTKSTVINIDSFIKGFTPTHQTINNMSKTDLERWMTEMFMRVVSSAETAG